MTGSKTYSIALGLLFLAVLVYPAAASVGDRLPEFQTCVSHCVDNDCIKGQHQIPFYLRLFFWTCAQDCDYMCQKVVTAVRVSKGLPVEQFHGKWPFDRFLGIQEPASVVFSMLNFLPNFLGFRLIHRLTSGHDAATRALPRFLVNVYKGFAVIGMNAWVWSTVFHMRDFTLTERLDYFSAGLTITYGFFTAAVRVFRLDEAQNVVVRYALMAVCVGCYLGHVYYLQFVTFSYSYNMLANVVVGLLQNVLWIYHSIASYRAATEVSPHASNGWRLWPAFIVLGITLAMSLELFDFPPVLDAFDAHSLWHLGTVLPTFWWYAYMKRDIQQLKQSKQKE